jgi:hydrogenase expression/formation protein HypE
MDRPRLDIGHGSGGRKTHRLIKELFLKHFSNPILARLEDAAELSLPARPLAFTTDSHLVRPLFFPGGDIGRLAVFGTANDLAMKGARPIYISAAFIGQAGLELEILESVVRSMSQAAKECETVIVAGDTKIIEATQDKAELFIITAGIGICEGDSRLGPEAIEPGDKVYINGPIGEHETAVLLARGDFKLLGEVRSDLANLYPLIESLLKKECAVHMLRDPTRGGIGTTLNEISELSGLGIIIDEATLPISPQVRAVCDLLGLDPLYLASEGRALIIGGDGILEVLKAHHLGQEGAQIGIVVKEPKGVWLRTPVGSLRPILMLEATQLPRIC